MNGTVSPGGLPKVFSYLNQSAHSLVADGSAFSSVINYPYRIGLSVVNATKLQYEQAVDSENLIPSLQSLLETIGYFFSSYAIASFVTALILNRFVIMASLRSNTTRVSLPLWSRLALHLSAILPLLYIVIQTLSQAQLINVLPPVDFSLYLARTFTIFAWSHCAETLVTTTTNTKPLEESNYTIFELSVQFYYLSQRFHYKTMAPEYLSDCMMALLGRVWIHVVEMLNIRKHRLAGSTVLNLLNIAYLFYQTKKLGFESIPVSTRYRHFPTIFSLFLIVLSVMSYALACLLRKNPFGPHHSDTTDLQFNSFMHNWWSHLNCTGEEEFSHVANKLALLLCNGNESLNKGIHREFSPLNHPPSIHHSYMISGYLNKVKTIPEDLDSTKIDQTAHKLGTPALVSKFRITWSLLTAGFTFFVKRKWQVKNDQNLSADNKDKIIRDFNRFVTEKNYVKFLTRSDNDSKDSGEPSLLPEEDYSEDYHPDVDIESEDELSSLGDHEDETDDELLTTMAPNDMNWFMSMWPILKLHVEKNSRLTRSQYAAFNARDILVDVVSQRRAVTHSNTSSPRGQATLDDDDDDLRSNCVVCKMNPRNVVLWPCTCFALCEDCRISLGLRGFNSCVCCRTEIHGYSRLNNV